MIRLHQLDFRQKLTLILATGAFTVFGMAVAILLIYQAFTSEGRARQYLEPYAQLVSVSSMTAVDFEDGGRAQQILAPLSANPEIMEACIQMQDGKILARYLRQNTPDVSEKVISKPEGVYLNETSAELVQDLKHEANVVAQLHIWMNRSYLQTQARQTFWIFGLCILLLLAATLVLLIVLQRTIIRPIADLAQTANAIRTETNFSLRAPVKGTDEVAILSRSFNSMLDALQHRDETLKGLSSLQRAIVDRAAYPIISSDILGNITSYNPAAEKLLGFAAGEMIGKNSTASFHDAGEIAERAKQFSQELGTHIEPGFEVLVAHARREIPKELEWTVFHKDGRRIPVLLSVSAIHSKDNAITGFLGLMVDITERKEAEREIRRREQHFRTLIENASDLITVINPDSTISFQSPACERVLGYKQENMLGLRLYDLIHPDDAEKVSKAISEAFSHRDLPQEVAFRIKHREGSWKIIESVGRAMPNDSDRTEVILNSRDITQSAKLEEQLRQSQKLEAIGQLSGGIAHDFNNLLTVIQMHSALLEESDQISGELKESVVEINLSTERAANLTRQLLAFSRRQAMQLKPLDLNEIVSQMNRMLKRILGEDIQMQIHYSSHSASVQADSGMMEQVLLNLAVNARDAMPTGGKLLIETEIIELNGDYKSTMPLGRPGQFVCMSVSDSGCGIPQENLTKIFEPFFTTKDIGKGTGLGLATVYGIVQQHQGWVTVYSEVGHGTTFRVYLPLITKVPTFAEPASSLSLLPRGTETILFVEDEPALHKMGLKVLQRLGYTVLDAGNGIEAIEIWRIHSKRIHLLVTDIIMPGGLNGRELAEKLQHDNPLLPVVFMSGYSADIAGDCFTLREGTNFLGKPFNPSSLAMIVRSSLDHRPVDSA